MNYKGIRDRHLNVFWCYDSKPDLENNITKAFINTIDGLTLEEKRTLFRELFGINLDGEGWTFEYYLQKKPDLEKVKNIPDENKIMFCFSPTGEHWGYDGQDTHDNERVKASIKKIARAQNPSMDESAFKQLCNEWFKEYLRSSQRNGSIPDAWIFVYKDLTQIYVVAMEDKLYNLDPNQIHNHMEKSLLIHDASKTPLYCTYSQINEVLLKMKSWISEEFLEFMTIAGYRKVDSLIVACEADKEIRRRVAFEATENIAKKLNKGVVDQRDWRTWRINVKGYSYLHEINLQVREDGIAISLCFGSTQNSGSWMIQNIDSIHIEDPHLARLGTTFHLLYFRGRCIGNSYPDYFNHEGKMAEAIDEEKTNEFISYWKKNLEFIRTLAPSEAIELYQKLLNDGMINKESFDRLERQLSGKKNKVLVVPEIEAKFLWTYEEILQIGEDRLVSEMDEAIGKALQSFKLL